MGELHLDIIVDRLKREFGVEVNVGQPRVAYKESVTKSLEEKYIHKKQSGGAGQFAHVLMTFGPLDENSDAKNGLDFKNDMKGDNIKGEYIAYIEKGVAEAMESGPVAGYKVDGLRARLIDGSQHAVDSSGEAFRIAAKEACKSALKKAGVIILEPIMSVEVRVPEDYMGSVIGDLNKRRGMIEGTETNMGEMIINAHVPLAEMFGYVTALRSITQGRGIFTMEMSKYSEAPKSQFETSNV